MNQRDNEPKVPAGFVRTAEYGSYDKGLDADRTVLATGIGALPGYPEVVLAFITRGFVPAGSVVRWAEAMFSVSYVASDGGTYGRNFLSTEGQPGEDEARAYFAKLTDYEAVSRRRQEDAMQEETVYAPARAARAAQLEAERKAERERKNALARRRRNRKKEEDAERTIERCGSIGQLEQLCGVTDRAAFWMPFTKGAGVEGLDRGVAELKKRCRAVLLGKPVAA